ncbi:MAG: zinc ribbon domain-containing protein [Planctomycetota bacterium]
MDSSGCGFASRTRRPACRTRPGGFLMPTYEYECTVCGHRFERFQGMIEKPLQVCPQCGEKIRRVIGSGTVIHVKGGVSRGKKGGCSLENTGRTCCGRDNRCGKSSCENNL